MALDLGTTGICRHCNGHLAQAVQPGRPRYWVHHGTRLPRCPGRDTTAEPVTLEVVR